MNVLKKIWNVLTSAVVALVVLCAVVLMGSRLLGFQVFTVISGSMAPTYNVGDLIYVKKVDPTAIAVGDPVTFILNEELVVATHRVVDIDRENQCLYTKGDANEIADHAPVHYNNVIGVPKFRIPKLGYVSDFIQNPPGTYITIGAAVVLIILVFLPGRKKENFESAAQEPSENADLKE